MMEQNMSDSPGPFMPPRHELVDFHGDQLIAVVLEGDGVAIPLRLLCERIGDPLCPGCGRHHQPDEEHPF